MATRRNTHARLESQVLAKLWASKLSFLVEQKDRMTSSHFNQFSCPGVSSLEDCNVTRA